MTTAVLEQTVGKVALHARCLEAAVHQPKGWKVTVDGQDKPVYVEATQDGSILSVTFLAGPMPEGDHTVMLEMDGTALYCSMVSFVADSWWKHTLSVRLD